MSLRWVIFSPRATEAFSSEAGKKKAPPSADHNGGATFANAALANQYFWRTKCSFGDIAELGLAGIPQ